MAKSSKKEKKQIPSDLALMWGKLKAKKTQIDLKLKTIQNKIIEAIGCNNGISNEVQATYKNPSERKTIAAAKVLEFVKNCEDNKVFTKKELLSLFEKNTKVTMVSESYAWKELNIPILDEKDVKKIKVLNNV